MAGDTNDTENLWRWLSHSEDSIFILDGLTNLKGVVHQIVSPISNSESTIFLMNIYFDLIVLDQQEVCFLFQMLKLRKIWGKNLGKQIWLFGDFDKKMIISLTIQFRNHKTWFVNNDWSKKKLEGFQALQA